MSWFWKGAVSLIMAHISFDAMEPPYEFYDVFMGFLGLLWLGVGIACLVLYSRE